RLHGGDRLAARVLHQHDRRNADVIDRPAIRFPHLLSVEHAHPCQRIPCARLRQSTLFQQSIPDSRGFLRGLLGWLFAAQCTSTARSSPHTRRSCPCTTTGFCTAKGSTKRCARTTK